MCSAYLNLGFKSRPPIPRPLWWYAMATAPGHMRDESSQHQTLRCPLCMKGPACPDGGHFLCQHQAAVASQPCGCSAPIWAPSCSICHALPVPLFGAHSLCSIGWGSVGSPQGSAGSCTASPPRALSRSLIFFSLPGLLNSL